MKKRGFTLVEMLAVIVILGLIAVLTFPKILDVLSKQEGQVDTAEEKMIYASVETYLSEKREFYPARKDKNYCIKLEDLENGGYLSIDADDLDLTKVVVVRYKNDDKFEAELADECPENIDIEQTSDLAGLRCSISPDGYAVQKTVTISYPLSSSLSLAYCYSENNGTSWTKLSTFNGGQVNGKGVQKFTYNQTTQNNIQFMAKVVIGTDCNDSSLESATCTASVTNIDTTPIGSVVTLDESKIGKGYLKADGSCSISRVVYQDLYDKIDFSITSPSTNSKTFCLPNISGKMIKYQ